MDAARIESINALDADEITRRLSGSAADLAAFVRTAAEAGSAEAQAVFGQLLLDGRGVASDPVAALRWFMAAATQDHLEAINMVGRCYDLGWGTPIDKVRAAACFRTAAARGLDWGKYNFATALTLGEGIAQDQPAALKLFEQLAAKGNAKAANFVGSFHEDGWAVLRDVGKAAGFYARAAAGGDFRGQFNHARMLVEAGDIDAALDWLDRAKVGGNPRFRAQVADWLGKSDEPRLCAAANGFAA